MREGEARLPGCLPARRWAELLRDPASGAYRALGELYENDPALLRQKALLCLRAVEEFARRFGADREVFVVRSTGRINLMGMHIDHRGGCVNPIAIKEQFFAVGPRDDDRVGLTNVEKSLYPDESFAIRAELPSKPIDDWDTWTHQEHQKRVQAGTAGQWSNYPKAAVLYLQHIHTAKSGVFDPPLRGMDVCVAGNIPPAAGLSSSSALVVAMAEACIHRNQLAVSAADLVDYCGTAEWYVGTRGGKGDHAAIKFGKKDHILHIGSYPLAVDASPMPEGYAAVLANSLVEAKKQAGARDVFNERVASYDLGLLMLRRNFPEHAEKLQHLRDVNPERLGAAPQAIYRMIRSLPERATREDVRQLARPGGLLADCAAQVERILRTHAEPKNGYGIRQVCMYGVSECIRSPRVKELLRRGDIAGFGEIIVLSHDGDRVTRRVGGKRVPVDNRLSDAQIEGLIADLDSCEPARARRAALWRQPGGYGVSTPQQDTLVDIACGVPGVAGAGRVGAGLGGAVVILVKEEQAAAVVAALTAGYYEPNNLEPACEGVRPVGGSGVLIPK